MKSVFADTLYWVAIVRPDDQWREAALRARKELGPVRLVTTDEVLSEFLTGLSRAGEILRSQAVKMVRAIMSDPNVTVLPQSRASFLNGLGLYERRPDKTYSLVDCASMESMRAGGVQEILSNDGHFSQEGFSVLIRQ